MPGGVCRGRKKAEFEVEEVQERKVDTIHMGQGSEGEDQPSGPKREESSRQKERQVPGPCVRRMAIPFKEQPGDHCGQSRVSKGESLGEQMRMALKDSGFSPEHQRRMEGFGQRHWSDSWHMSVHPIFTTTDEAISEQRG